VTTPSHDGPIDSARNAAKMARELEQPAFISVVNDEVLAVYEDAATTLPLSGMPFAVKDNIDVAGMPTTAADPRRKVPASSDSYVVARLRAAGGVPVGKTNLDQYATGLVGTRTPYGPCHSVFSAAHISGGSSSGSAVAVAAGVVPFALGTDTAGSGRVPAAFNGLVGWKPTRGLVSTSGVLPACPSLDCVTTLTRDVGTARILAAIMSRYDEADPWSRRAPTTPTEGVAAVMNTVAVPAGPIDLDPMHAREWAFAVARARELFDVVEVDVEPFLEAARLLYDGPWLAERYAAFGAALIDDGPHLDPTVRRIVLDGEAVTGADTFRGLATLAALRRRTSPTFLEADVLMLPVTPGHPTLAEVAADPIGVNSRLGTFTNMVNLLDLCAVALPSGHREDGLPFGVQFLAPAFADSPLLDLAARWTGEPTPVASPSNGSVPLVVAGAHLSGEPLNGQLTSRGGRLLRRTRTAPSYRMFRLPGTPERPALARVESGGASFDVEVWKLPAQAVGELLPLVREPLGLGQIRLVDGTSLPGFVYAGSGSDLTDDLSQLKSWRHR
jgi:allophanate hydrolase